MSSNHPPGGANGPDFGGPQQRPDFGGPSGPNGPGGPQHGSPAGPPPGPQYGGPGYGNPGSAGSASGAPGGFDGGRPPGGFEEPGYGSGSAASANPPQYGQGGPQGPQGYGGYSPSPTTMGPGTMGPGSGGPGQPMGPGGPGGPQKKKSNAPMIALIASIGAVVVIAAIIAGVVLTRGNTTAGPGGGSSTAKAEVTNASDAVRGYLEAIAAGDATKALSYAKTEPADKTFLTNEVLASSNEQAPITDINVPEVTDEYAYSVAASYTIGDRKVNVEIRTDKTGDNWLIDEVASQIDVSRITQGMTVTINEVEVGATTVYLFPGTYTFDTGNKYVNYVEGKETLVIDEPSSYASASDLEIGLSSAGSKFMVDAAKKSLQACLAKKELAPKGCPYFANPNLENGAIKLNLATLKFTVNRDGFTDAKPRLDYDDPTKATFSFYPSIKYYVEGTRSSGAIYFDAFVRASETDTATMDFSTETPTFAWAA